MPKTFDVFLSYNRGDEIAVRELAAGLRAGGLLVWLDLDNLLPGQRWQEELEKVIGTAHAGMVVVGRDGIGPWQDQEMRALLSQFAKRRLPVIPVLLPGASQKPELPVFLQEFNWSDLRSGFAPEALDRLAAGIRRKPAAKAQPVLERYRSWAAERYSGLSLIGLGGGDVGRLRFEEVYVPLRIVRRHASPEMLPREEPGTGELGIEEIFRTPHASNPHALLLGDPGAGKTTGLLKLLHRCLAPDGPAALGLEAGTLPVFLRLRRFTSEDVDRPFAEFLQRELERELGDVAKGKAPKDLGARLWEHGRLLFLLDGLDEIADEGLRAEVCDLLDLELAHLKPIRAVLSCRFAGYGDKVRLNDRFSALEVRPLDAGQCRDLVRSWFHAVQRAQPDRLSKREVLAAADGLTTALDGPGFGSQRWKVLVGSPLLLTLLCVIAYRGGQMPRHRAAFYDQCLRVLLGSWSRGKRSETAAGEAAEPPLDVETALAVLRSLAWELHSRGTWDDLSVSEIAARVRNCLAPRGLQVEGRQVFEWLRREAGVLADYGEHRYGLLHLGLQEYLTACHIAHQGTALLDELCGHAGEEWWQEVFLLLAGLPGHGVFAPLMDRLLRSRVLLDQANLIRACLEEAAEPDVGPFLALLEPSEPPERQAIVLRLLRGRHDPRIEAPVRDLLRSSQADVRALAEQIAAGFAAQPAAMAGEAGAVFVLCSSEDREAAAGLARGLRRRGWKATAATEDASWRRDPERLVRETRGVVVTVTGGKPCWEERELRSCLELFAMERSPLVLADLAAGGRRPELPGFLSAAAWVDFRQGLTPAGLAALDHALAGVSAADSSEPLVEPATRIRFVWIPGGRFEMGEGTKFAGPVHPVRVTPFWLGETPVTNAQYAVFLEKTGAREPKYWRARRFSSPDQPVVGVSWEEAQAFCRWLGKVWRRPVMLPTEAQWEFAARGPKSRKYPWGDESPDATRACFNLDGIRGQPAPVGSYPAGRGPFGTFDQAGNVWEWCRDAGDEKAYANRAANKEEPVDPFIGGNANSFRILRGGGWLNTAEGLRAAIRRRHSARSQDGAFGFRVAAAPASS
ncbi:MAG TPA: SUMF1/EgtB/PvdO family nonheme iron enzyme [Thermoanaerobaculia bacterium]|nr:SUMF1/EgtB/PvdO family nonheme iron enzyme [Thermoanaerobaculia bacterium]